MRRILTISAVVILALALVGFFVVRRFGGCRSLRTRISERKLYTSTTTMRTPAEDWPAWRGPRNDGISRESVDKWRMDAPRQLWSADVGLGYSSPIAARGRIYLFTLDNQREALTAFDANSGKIIWNQEHNAGWTGQYPGTRSTPTIDANRIYTFGGAGGLICRDLDYGKTIWHVNTLRTIGAGNIKWGVSSSPLIHGDLVYVQGGKGGPIAVAVNKLTGEVAWKSETTGLSGYAQPIIVDVSGAKQLIVFGGDALWGIDPASGKTIWSHPWKTSYDVNAAPPVFAEGHLFITSGYGRGCATFRLSPGGATLLWESREIGSRFQPVILERGLLFGSDEGTVKCLSWPDGALKWAARDSKLKIGVGGSLLRAGDKLLLLSEKGVLSLIRADRNGAELIGQCQVVDGSEIWSAPLLYGGRLYVKGTRELICYDFTQ